MGRREGKHHLCLLLLDPKRNNSAKRTRSDLETKMGHVYGGWMEEGASKSPPAGFQSSKPPDGCCSESPTTAMCRYGMRTRTEDDDDDEGGDGGAASFDNGIWLLAHHLHHPHESNSSPRNPFPCYLRFQLLLVALQMASCCLLFVNLHPPGDLRLLISLLRSFVGVLAVGYSFSGQLWCSVRRFQKVLFCGEGVGI